MSLDTKALRMSVVGVGRPWMRTKHPSFFEDKDKAWRMTTGNTRFVAFSATPLADDPVQRISVSGDTVGRTAVSGDVVNREAVTGGTIGRTEVSGGVVHRQSTTGDTVRRV